MPRLICRKLLRQSVLLAETLARDRAGSNNAARAAMMAMTTNNSIRVSPLFSWQFRRTRVRTVQGYMTHAATQQHLAWLVGWGNGRLTYDVRLVCCFMGCDERPFNPLLSALPSMIHLRAGHATATAGWLTTVINRKGGSPETLVGKPRALRRRGRGPSEPLTDTS